MTIDQFWGLQTEDDIQPEDFEKLKDRVSTALDQNQNRVIDDCVGAHSEKEVKKREKKKNEKEQQQA